MHEFFQYLGSIIKLSKFFCHFIQYLIPYTAVIIYISKQFFLKLKNLKYILYLVVSGEQWEFPIVCKYIYTFKRGLICEHFDVTSVFIA